MNKQTKEMQKADNLAVEQSFTDQYISWCDDLFDINYLFYLETASCEVIFVFFVSDPHFIKKLSFVI